MHLPSEQINLRHSITTLQEQGSASEHLNPAKAFYALKVHDVSQTYLINRTDDREKLAMHLGLHSIVQRRPHILGKKLLVWSSFNASILTRQIAVASMVTNHELSCRIRSADSQPYCSNPIAYGPRSYP